MEYQPNKNINDEQTRVQEEPLATYVIDKNTINLIVPKLLQIGIKLEDIAEITHVPLHQLQKLNFQNQA
jgi:hypothetical protein